MSAEWICKLGLFASIRIQVSQNPDYDPRAKLDAHVALPYSISTATTVVRIESNLPGLIGQLGSLSLKNEVRLRTTTSTSSRSGNVESSQVGANAKPVAQRPWPNALELYFSTPAAQQRTGLGYLHRVSYSSAVKAQFQLADSGGKTWYFPAPSPKTLVAASETNRQPDFSNNEQPFWASE